MIMGTGSELQRFLQEQIEIYGDELALELTVLEASRKAPAYPAAPVLPVQAVREIAPLELAKTQRAPLDLQAATLAELHERIGGCLNCAIGHQRKHLVFGTGNPAADIVLVGEAPGRDEDLSGLPFVGRAGKLLDKMLAAVGLDRDKVYIANVVPWRPPGNRKPTANETEIMRPFLERQIELCAPAMLMTLGGAATSQLLKTGQGILSLRGRWTSCRIGGRDIPLMPTIHPAALLRNSAQKRLVWRDFRELARRLAEAGG